MKEGINSTNVPKKKEAMKRIIGSMMSGVGVYIFKDIYY